MSDLQKKTSGLAIASLVLGIISFCGGGVIFIPPILAVIFAALAFSNIKKDANIGGHGLAVAGLVLGILSILGYIIYWIIASATILALIGASAK